VLRHLDADDSHILEKHERDELAKGLAHPEKFLAEQIATNPLLKEIMES